MNRTDLHNVLLSICNNVYFQPPENIKLIYPAIIYGRANIDNIKANNENYMVNRIYEITLINADPNTDMVGKINKLKYCKHVRSFKSNNMNHDVYKIYNIEGE